MGPTRGLGSEHAAGGLLRSAERICGGGGMRPVRIPLRNPIASADLVEKEDERHRRNWLVRGIGPQGHARLAASRILVVGAGGLGSPVLLYLGAAGVGTLGICDFDVVERSNLSRQVIHADRSVGHNKAESAAQHLQALDPDLTVHTFGRVTSEFLDAHRDEWDLILECSDNFSTKYLVADWCAASGVPLVWGTVVDMIFQVSVFWSRPLPGIPATTLRDLHPRIPDPGTTPVSTQVGVLGPVVGQAGTIMATEAIKLITGVGRPLIGQVLYGDSRQNRYETLTFARVEDE
ncbi:HesA/MoeB/ThiF family protein [Schaalia sp. ZJ1691]|uniref:HesA/MoeB/ThiF family protein n=1 Tax=Schaalia sp. ZJ1691 TaxID=2709404 RepID=UPI001F14AE82|nr:HesA/MoeB/ThiF family protein [Schaalia sp. ZJ1691]